MLAVYQLILIKLPIEKCVDVASATRDSGTLFLLLPWSFFETNTTTQCNANTLQVKEGARDQSCVILAERQRGVLSLALKCEIYPWISWILSQIKTLNTPLEIEMETKVRHESHSYSLVELKRNGNNWNAIKDSQLERPQTHSKHSLAENLASFPLFYIMAIHIFVVVVQYNVFVAVKFDGHCMNKTTRATKMLQCRVGAA